MNQETILYLWGACLVATIIIYIKILKAEALINKVREQHEKIADLISKIETVIDEPRGGAGGSGMMTNSRLHVNCFRCGNPMEESNEF